MLKINIMGVGMEITPSIKTYIEKKFQKLERYQSLISQISVHCKQKTSTRGVSNDFKVEATIEVPNTVVRAEKPGGDLYALVDEIMDVLTRRMERYKKLLVRWKQGKLEENYYEEMINDKEDNTQFMTYIPKVSKRKKLAYCSPMHEAEAIERMELSGLTFYLFKNIKNNIWSVVYKRDDGTYGILEPENA